MSTVTGYFYSLRKSRPLSRDENNKSSISNRVYIKIIGSVEAKKMAGLIEGLKLLCSLPFKVGENSEYPSYAFDPKRNQYYANKILSKLLDEIPEDADKLIGITDVDLCTPVLSYIFGEAQLNGRVAVVSIHRLRQEFYHLPCDDELLSRRLKKEFIHELGHCYGLIHCDNPNCVMFLSNSMMNIDNKHSTFCNRCEEFFDQKINKKENK